MTDLDNALARLGSAGIETPTPVAQWHGWFHADAPFGGHSVVSDTADAAILALANLACDLLASEPAVDAHGFPSTSPSAVKPLVARLSA